MRTLVYLKIIRTFSIFSDDWLTRTLIICIKWLCITFSSVAEFMLRENILFIDSMLSEPSFFCVSIKLKILFLKNKNFLNIKLFYNLRHFTAYFFKSSWTKSSNLAVFKHKSISCWLRSFLTLMASEQLQTATELSTFAKNWFVRMNLFRSFTSMPGNTEHMRSTTSSWNCRSATGLNETSSLGTETKQASIEV